MDSEIEAKIKSAVREILGESDMNVMTEYKVRKLASERLELDLSKPSYKAIVRRIVQSFLEEQKEKEEEEQKEKVEEEEEEEQKEEEEEEEEEDKVKSGGAKEYDDDGDLIVCRLSEKRKVTIQDFKGRSLVSIREFYKKDGKELPTSKGISLTEEQWSTFKKNVPAIEKAISKMESRFG